MLINDVFRCPECHVPLDADSGRTVSGHGCPACRPGFKNSGGVLAFVRRPEVAEEKAFYDDVYSQSEGSAEKRLPASVAHLWSDPWAPQDALVLRKTLPIEGRRILILGNGTSGKELHLLDYKPGVYIYSDLSPHAAQRMRDSFDWSRGPSRVYFASIDAQDLPFQDGSLDIIYSYAMVHHLPDLPRFFAEVMRVLRPGGRTVFLDDAYSPVWHFAKTTFARPLMTYSHRTTGISPEDLRFSLSGGFRERELAKQIAAAGGQAWFQRTGFLNYLWYRASIKLAPTSARRWLVPRIVGHILNGLDAVLARVPVLKHNLIRLAWGISKGVPYTG